MKHVVLSFLVLLSLGFATGVQAGKPILGTVIESDHIYPMQRINATEWTESGDATKAFIFCKIDSASLTSMRCGTILIPTSFIGEVRLPAIGWR
jgi:hypothetical protein